MGIFLKIIGFLLLVVGLYALFVTIPQLLLNTVVDSINPLVQFGIVQPSVTASGNIMDLILGLVLVGVGILFIKKHNKVIPQFPKR